MKKNKILVLFLLLLIGGGSALGQVGNFTKVRVRDSVISLTADTDLILRGQGTGGVNIEGEYTLPQSDGTVGQVLSTDGAGNITFEDGSGGDVTKVGTPANNQIGVWTGDGTIEGEPNLVYSSNILDVLGISNPIIRTQITSGTIGLAGFIATTPLTGINIAANNSTTVGTTMGLANAGLIYLITNGGISNSNLVIGTTTAIPFNFGTNNVIAGIIDGTTQDWDFNGNNLTGIASFEVLGNFQVENRIETTGDGGHANLFLISDGGSLQISQGGSTETSSKLGVLNAGNAHIVGPTSGTLAIGGGGSGGDFSIGTNSAVRLNVSIGGVFDFQGNPIIAGKVTTTTTTTDAGLLLGSFTSDPSSLSNGDMWYNSSTDKLRGRENGASVDK